MTFILGSKSVLLQTSLRPMWRDCNAPIGKPIGVGGLQSHWRLIEERLPVLAQFYRSELLTAPFAKYGSHGD